MEKTKKSYRQRFLEFRSGVCPYCGNKKPKTITLTKNRKGYYGHCKECNAGNNFTNPACKEWYDGYVEGTS
jgi:transcription elongation factor Elf1